MQTRSLVSRARPFESYTEALQRIEALQFSEETALLNPVSRLMLLSHGQKAARSVVFFHSYTNSPQQFVTLAQQCYERGFNVLVPRAPHHGLAERLTNETAQLTAEELAVYADLAVDIAHGLGEQVVIAGLSMGGVLTAWLAQQREDITLGLILSPAFSVRALPTRFARLAAELIQLAPDTFRWWDPVLKNTDLPPLHAYPRFSMHGLTQIMRLGFAMQAMSQVSKPAARQVCLILNANDDAVDNVLSQGIFKNWISAGAENASCYTFSAELDLPHDYIDPIQLNQDINKTYPTLLDLMEGRTPS